MAAQFSSLVSSGREFGKLVVTVAKNNPAVATTAVVGVSGMAILAAPVVVAAPIIAGIQGVGFGTGGIVGGTLAASAQASAGNVIAPGLLATLTSAGAGGYGVAAICGAAQAVGGTMIGAAGVAGAWLTTRAQRQ